MNKEITVWKGNHAMAEAAIRAGFRFYAGYPITPATPFLEYMSYRMAEAGGTFVQASSEVEAPAMLMGATFAGRMALTATAGPGLALMMEGLAAMGGARFPALIVMINRTGAAAGGLPGCQDCYKMVTGSLGNGGMHAFVLGPQSMQEAIDLIYEVPTLFDKYHTPVIVLADAMLAQMIEAGIKMPAYKELPTEMYKRPYVIDRPNQKGVYVEISDTPRNGPFERQGFDAQANIEWNYQNNEKMYEDWKTDEVKYEEYCMEDAEYVIAAWGSQARFAKDAVDKLRAEGIKAGMLRAITLFPFPEHQFRNLDKNKVKGVMSIELAVPSQFYFDVRASVDQDIYVKNMHRITGIYCADEIVDGVRDLMEEVR